MVQRTQHLTSRGARCSFGPEDAKHASVEITGDRITQIHSLPPVHGAIVADSSDIDLSGFLLLPGLINAHDHLHFALFPRMGNPPYLNYVEWGNDIHRGFSELIARHRSVPKDVRLWWGGIRNLLCGVTTVCHHDPCWPTLQSPDFPVRVVQDYGWGHSPALGGDLRKARSATPDGCAFIVHACEGIDELAREELHKLEQLGLLDGNTVVVHGLAIDHEGVLLMRQRGASLIVCPSSNHFLFRTLPDIPLLRKIEKIALGSDSPLTAEGDFLDELRFAMQYAGISPSTAYHMATTIPAAILRLRNAEGSIEEAGRCDLIAVRDTGQGPAGRLETLSANDIEFVMIGGRIQLASETTLRRLPSSTRHGLEPLAIDGMIRWLRAPVKMLVQKAEEALGEGRVRLGNRRVQILADIEAAHACCGA